MNPIAKRTITALTTAAVVVLAVIYSPVIVIQAALALLFALSLYEFSALLRIKRNFPVAIIGLVMLAICFYALGFIVQQSGNLMLLFTIAVVKISDMGGFAFGLSSARLMKGGNHKLCPSISPNKSWEGLLGSVIGSCIVATAFMSLTKLGVWQSLVVGVAAALFGTAGDLIESKFKRWVGVKDSSTMKLTNGMGGFLDMFDSLLIAPTVVIILINAFK